MGKDDTGMIAAANGGKGGMLQGLRQYWEKRMGLSAECCGLWYAIEALGVIMDAASPCFRATRVHRQIIV